MTCPNCEAPDVSIRHGVWECYRARNLWRLLEAIFAQIRGRTDAPMQHWYEVALGTRGLDDPSDAEAIVWMALHGAMLSSLHNGWCQAAHVIDQPGSTTWGSFRGAMASMTLTAWHIYESEFSIPQFWEEWGNNQVLARPEDPSHRGPQGFPTLLPGIPVRWDAG